MAAPQGFQPSDPSTGALPSYRPAPAPSMGLPPAPVRYRPPGAVSTAAVLSYILAAPIVIAGIVGMSDRLTVFRLLDALNVDISSGVDVNTIVTAVSLSLILIGILYFTAAVKLHRGSGRGGLITLTLLFAVIEGVVTLASGPDGAGAAFILFVLHVLIFVLCTMPSTGRYIRANRPVPVPRA